MIDETYLCFSADSLREHFCHVKRVEGKPDPVEYYLQRADRYRRFVSERRDRRGLPISMTKVACQIEKDERFWVANCLMALFHRLDRTAFLAAAMRESFQTDVPPVADVASWHHCFGERLQLFFEVSLPAPAGYKEWLRTHVDERTLVPYVRDAARMVGEDRIKASLEGATHVDALLVDPDSHVAVIFEAKVTSDISPGVSFDLMRNQIARNIDVLLEPPSSKAHALLAQREPPKTLFVLLTPQLFKDEPHARHYGAVMEAYRERPSKALVRDLPHRTREELADVSGRLGWLTWEDCARIEPLTCPWLGHR